jgi:hypothetical protein
MAWPGTHSAQWAAQGSSILSSVSCTHGLCALQGQRLAPKCRQLVLVAAPKDARAYFEYPESTNAIISKVGLRSCCF